MTISRATYCTREDVIAVLGQAASPRAYTRIDRAIESATTSIDARVHRTFHPTTATRYFDWPDESSAAVAYRLWLDANDLLSVITLTSGGTTIPPAGYLLEPQKYGPPYTHLELNTSTQYGFSTGSTNQRAIAITGVWGFTAQVESAAVLTATATATAATVTVSNGARLGVGDLLTIDAERLTVTGRTWADTGKTITAGLTASSAVQAVSVTAGTDFAEGETILIDSEQLLITAIAANTLICERAVNSSVLGVHTLGAAIYSPRTLTVARAANGTTAGIHSTTSTVYRALVPGNVQALAVGEALVEVQQVDAGYARTAGSGDNERVIGAGAGLGDLRDQVETAYRRKVRSRAV